MAVAGTMPSARNSSPMNTSPGMVWNTDSRGMMRFETRRGSRERRIPTVSPRRNPNATDTTTYPVWTARALASAPP